MKKVLIFTFTALFFFPCPAWSKDKKMPKGFYTNSDIRFEHCKDEKLEINLVLCFAPPHIHSAYSAFTGFYTQIPASQKAWNYLQIQGLYSGKDQYERHVPYLKKLGVKNDAFFALYKAATEWAETEKQKPAEELYALAYQPDTIVEDKDVLYSLLHAYLSLAAQKGHTRARQELDDISDMSWQNFLDKYGHEHPKLLKYLHD